MCDIGKKKFKTSHLPIVDACSLELMKTEGEILIKSNLGKYKLKTIADIFADVLSVRSDHLVIPWKTKDKPIGFQFIFFVEESPYFIPNDDYPIRIPLKKEFIEFPLPVEEDEALDLWRKKLLWNAIGKKSLGRGRSLTHQTPWETEILVQLLVNKNRGSCLRQFSQKSHTKDVIPISIQNQLCIKNGVNENKEIPNDLKKVPIQNIRWDDGKGRFIVEKALEAWVMENIDKNAGESFRGNILELTDESSIISFHNYLPFGVQGSNIDLVIFTKASNNDKSEDEIVVHILELKVGSISYGEFAKTEESEVNKYAKFITSFLRAYGIKHSIKKGIISFKPSGKSIDDYLQKYKGTTEWFYYEIDCSNKTVKFSKVAG